ncbi:MAG: MFS transporter [Acidaminococcales bacterium]|jgi:MFS family permease|nr:MFS transporter [Acidaminococcales bacterium]
MINSEAHKKSSGNMVVFAAWLAVFCLFGYRSSFSLLLRPLASGMGWTVGQTSMGYSLMMVIYGVTAYFSGMIVDKWGTRQAFAIGSVFAALGFFLCSFADSYATYLLTYSLFAGIGTGMLWVSSTASVRKWFIGRYYGKSWGMAFMGAPMAQLLLSLVLNQLLLTMDWREAMRILAAIVFVLLAMAAFFARKNPDHYGYEPYGLVAPVAGAAAPPPWDVKTAFKTWPIWGAVIAFLGSMMAEFLIWTQLVNYWITTHGFSTATAGTLYIAIGVCGLVTMPGTGVVADSLVGKLGSEGKARKLMVIIAPICGIIGVLILRLSGVSMAYGIIACVFFAIYWAIEPGGIAGYVGTIYGGKNFGKIWGLGTLVVMGIGPATGSFLGGYFLDVTGSYDASFSFALWSYVASALFALTLPIKQAFPGAK